jgi:hypothetical protein
LTDDFLLLDQQRAFEKAVNVAKERDNVQVKEFTFKKFEGIFRAVEVVKQNIMDADSNLDRSMWIKRSASTSMCMKI